MALAYCAAATLAVLSFATSASAHSGPGRLDPSFGTNGRTIALSGEGVADVQIANSPGGAVVVSDPLGGRVLRFLPDGSLDTAFGDVGELSLGANSADEGVEARLFSPKGVAVDSLGRILVFGEQTDPSQAYKPPVSIQSVPSSAALVLRFTSEGRPDPSFGEGAGFIRGDFGLGSGLSTDIPMVGAMTGRVDSRDRPVFIAGVSSGVSGCYSRVGSIAEHPRAVVRLTASGRPDPSFGGGDGVVPIEGSASFPGLWIDGSDRPVAEVGRIGGSMPECRPGTDIYSLRQDGRRLAGHGSDGLRFFKRLHLAVLERSGAMVLSYRYKRTLKVVSLRPDGSRDLSLGPSGVAKVHLPVAGLHMRPAAVDGRGRILLAGFVGSPVSVPAKDQPKRSSFVVARLLPDGSLDRAFGNDGWVFTSFPLPLEVTSAKATLDSHGRLLVAGTLTKDPDRSSNTRFALARYLLGP